MSSDAGFLRVSDALGGWWDAVKRGEKPVRWPVGPGDWRSVSIGPGRVVLLGGAPNTGKSALVLQWTVDALLMTDDLRCLLANVEMPVDVLIDRIVARLAEVDVTAIHERDLTDLQAEAVMDAVERLEGIGDRLAFLRPPFDLSNVAAAADAVGANLIALDYLQRFEPPGEHRTRREAANATMEYLRRFSDAGVGVLGVAAVARTKDRGGRQSYDAAGLNLASFRESSELEFGADDAYLLVPDPDAEGCLSLRHVKSRYGRRQDLRLRFQGPLMRFDVLPEGAVPHRHKPPAEPPDLRDLWDRTRAAR